MEIAKVTTNGPANERILNTDKRFNVLVLLANKPN